MATPIEVSPQAVLTLAQWLSPAYPVGGFAYSHGLEWLVESGQVGNAAQLRDWLEQVLRHGLGWDDALFLAAAYRAAPDEVEEIDALCRAFAASKERLMETELQGAAFCSVTAAIFQADLANLCYPVALGRAARLADLPLALTAQMYLQAVLSNLVGAAQRLMALGQTEGQRLIRSLTPHCGELAEAALGADLSDLGSSSFVADIAAMKHETQYSRSFRT